eukprot:c12715_g1_i1.p1 GENE.c12715_g1_i1~~c12715_g1_i1.p1  ORF type:complete len:793 (+),score=236.18 c12715_g1_i1:2250-4628(+)
MIVRMSPDSSLLVAGTDSSPSLLTFDLTKFPGTLLAQSLNPSVTRIQETGGFSFGTGIADSAHFRPNMVKSVAISPQRTATNQTLWQLVLTVFSIDTAYDVSTVTLSNMTSFLPNDMWAITNSSVRIQFLEYYVTLVVQPSLPDGLYLLSPDASVTSFNTHEIMLDRVRPEVFLSFAGDTVHNSSYPFASTAHCDVITNSPFLAVVVGFTEHVTVLCVNGPHHAISASISGITTNTTSFTPPMFQLQDASVLPACNSTGCTSSACPLIIAVDCDECAVTLQIPEGVVADVAGNRNVPSNVLVVCVDTLRPAPTFQYNDTTVSTLTTTSGTIELVVDFGETVHGMSENILQCTGCSVSNISEIEGGQNFGFEVKLESSTSSIVILSDMLFDLAGNTNIRSQVSIVLDSTRITFLSKSVLAGIVVVDSLLIVAACVTSGIVFRFRKSDMITHSSPLFHHVVVVSLVLVVVANVLGGVALVDLPRTTRERACESALHVGVYGVTLFFSSLIVRNYGVWRSPDATRLPEKDLVVFVSACFGVVVFLMLCWSGLFGATSELNSHGYYQCRVKGVGVLYALIALLGVLYISGGYVALQVYRSTSHPPNTETKAIVFSMYNAIFIVVVYGGVRSTTATATADFVLLSLSLLYFVVSPLLAIFWITKFFVLFTDSGAPGFQKRGNQRRYVFKKEQDSMTNDTSISKKSISTASTSNAQSSGTAPIMGNALRREGSIAKKNVAYHNASSNNTDTSSATTSKSQTKKASDAKPQPKSPIPPPNIRWTRASLLGKKSDTILEP